MLQEDLLRWSVAVPVPAAPELSGAQTVPASGMSHAQRLEDGGLRLRQVSLAEHHRGGQRRKVSWHEPWKSLLHFLENLHRGSRPMSGDQLE